MNKTLPCICYILAITGIAMFPLFIQAKQLFSPYLLINMKPWSFKPPYVRTVSSAFAGCEDNKKGMRCDKILQHKVVAWAKLARDKGGVQRAEENRSSKDQRPKGRWAVCR